MSTPYLGPKHRELIVRRHHPKDDSVRTLYQSAKRPKEQNPIY